MMYAYSLALKGLKEGGIPIGSILVRGEEILAEGYNQRVQKDNQILHGEMDCLNNLGRIGSFENTTIYSTLMPCYMCGGTIVQFGIPKVVVAEDENFTGSKKFMESHGIEVINLNLNIVKETMSKFIKENPKLWFEDIGG